MKRAITGLLAGVIVTISVISTQAYGQEKWPPSVRVIPLEPGDKSYFLLLRGQPETKSFRSGLVTLEPGKSIGVHNSGVNEEMLVPLEGQGELRFPGYASVSIKPGVVTYAPAHSEHDVINTGSVRLRYIFITARAE